MPPKEDRKGRQAFGQHDGNRSRASSATPQTPKGTPATPRKMSAAPGNAGHAGSAPARQPTAKKQKHADANKENEYPITEPQMKRIVRAVMKALKEAKDESADLRTDNAGSDIFDKKAVFQGEKMADRKWSNYPIALPPQLNADLVLAVRKNLNDINNKTLMSYSSENAQVVNAWELGVLQCYDGVTEDYASNFLSCDVVNPAYLKDAEVTEEKPKQQRPYLSNKSCFVYAPVGFLLSEEKNGETVPVALSNAKENWQNSAKSGGRIDKKTATPGWNTTPENIVSSCWLYTEEFVDYVNKDKNPAHKTYDSVYNKGRIGMFFRIKPIEAKSDFKYLPTEDDHIGWGSIEALGGDKLESDFIPKSWAHLQAKIGRYILLTNIWSSTETDVYLSEVDQTVLKEIYMRVYTMTTKNTIVSVRRGSGAHGRLCVVQKKIELNPEDENFGLDLKTNKKCELYVTQIFTARKRLTSDTGNESGRMNFTQAHEWLSNKNLSNEEKNLVAIFQSFNRKTIALMKDQAYRKVMQKFWTEKTANVPNRCSGMPAGVNDWRMSSMKAVLVTMLLTSYNVVFIKLPGKVACRERYLRFLDIVKHYRYWFVKSNCIPDNDYVVKFEKDTEMAAADASQFNGMLPGKQIGDQANSTSDLKRYQKPQFDIDSGNDEGDKRGTDSNEDRLREVEKLTEKQKMLEEMYANPMAEADYDQTLAALTETPTPTGMTKRFLEINKDKLVRKDARWGQDEDSFTARLAKLQNW